MEIQAGYNLIELRNSLTKSISRRHRSKSISEEERLTHSLAINLHSKNIQKALKSRNVAAYVLRFLPQAEPTSNQNDHKLSHLLLR